MPTWVNRAKSSQAMFLEVGGVLPQKDGLSISGGIIHDYQDVFVATGKLSELPYQVHTHTLKGDPDDGQVDERCQG